MTRKTILTLAIGALTLTACGEPGELGGTTLPDATTTSEQTTTTTVPSLESTMPEVPPSNPDTAPESVVDRAISDLVDRTTVSSETITVVAAESKTWPDGSLGCPQPGMSYTQALVDGSRVLLEADGRLYAYHAGPDGEPFLCESGEKDGGYDFVPSPGFDE
ncbi:MAG: hypothetical protein ACFCU2_00850 [Acidimicrobiia bacterium]